MSNEQKKSRTLIEDLPVAEQEMTAAEMENVQGGKTFFESRSNTTKTETTAPLTTAIAPTPPPPDSKTQTPLPPGKTQTPL